MLYRRARPKQKPPDEAIIPSLQGRRVDEKPARSPQANPSPMRAKACLVFSRKQRTVLVVDQPWYRSFFRRRQTRQPETRETRADHGDADAQFSLGQGFDQNGGTTADQGQAVGWYRRAATQNHASAQFNLGRMLADGRGATRDDSEARQWILQAAQQGHAAAQHELGVRHRRAGFEGSAEEAADSNVEAYKWFRLAAAQGHSRSAGELENLTLRLTHQQVLEGNQRAAGFVAHASTPVGARQSPGPELKKGKTTL